MIDIDRCVFLWGKHPKLIASLSFTTLLVEQYLCHAYRGQYGGRSECCSSTGVDTASTSDRKNRLYHQDLVCCSCSFAYKHMLPEHTLYQQMGLVTNLM